MQGDKDLIPMKDNPFSDEALIQRLNSAPNAYSKIELVLDFLLSRAIGECSHDLYGRIEFDSPARCQTNLDQCSHIFAEILPGYMIFGVRIPNRNKQTVWSTLNSVERRMLVNALAKLFRQAPYPLGNRFAKSLKTFENLRATNLAESQVPSTLVLEHIVKERLRVPQVTFMAMVRCFIGTVHSTSEVSTRSCKKYTDEIIGQSARINPYSASKVVSTKLLKKEFGICHQAAAAFCGLLVELGVPPSRVYLETGLFWIPAYIHSWVGVQFETGGRVEGFEVTGCALIFRHIKHCLARYYRVLLPLWHISARLDVILTEVGE